MNGRLALLIAGLEYTEMASSRIRDGSSRNDFAVLVMGSAVGASACMSGTKLGKRRCVVPQTIRALTRHVPRLTPTLGSKCENLTPHDLASEIVSD